MWGSIIKIGGGGIIAAVGAICVVIGTLTSLPSAGLGIPIAIAGGGVTAIGAGEVVAGVAELLEGAPPGPSMAGTTAPGPTTGRTIIGTEGDDLLKGTEWSDASLPL